MFCLEIFRVRLDLGNDVFIEVSEAIGEKILESKTLDGLVLKLKEFVKSRNGQIIQFGEGNVTFDTTDCTYYVQLDKKDSAPTNSEVNAFDSLF